MTTFGSYVVLSDPDPTAAVVREAKRLLVESIRKTQETHQKAVKNLRMIVQRNYEVEDPDTGEKAVVAIVGWKAELTPKETP